MTSPAVLVTGATGGIGRTICRVLSEAGYSVLAHFNRDVQGALDLQDGIRSVGGRCEILHADLGTSAGPTELARAAISLIDDSGIPLHGIVNNAAVLLGPTFDSITSSNFDEFFDVNTRAPLLLVRELLPVMRDGGSIVNISSASAHLSSPGNILYAMSKAAIESFTRNLAEAVAPRRIRVNAVVPGFTDNGHPAFSDATALEYMGSFSVLGGVASPDAVAHAVRFLLSSDSGRTTGSLLDVSGGTTLAPRGARAKSVRDVVPLQPGSAL